MSKTSQRKASLYALGYHDAKHGMRARYKLNVWSREYFAGRRKYFFEIEKKRSGIIQRIADKFK